MGSRRGEDAPAKKRGARAPSGTRLRVEDPNGSKAHAKRRTFHCPNDLWDAVLEEAARTQKKYSYVIVDWMRLGLAEQTRSRANVERSVDATTLATRRAFAAGIRLRAANCEPEVTKLRALLAERATLPASPLDQFAEEAGLDPAAFAAALDLLVLLGEVIVEGTGDRPIVAMNALRDTPWTNLKIRSGG